MKPRHPVSSHQRRITDLEGLDDRTQLIDLERSAGGYEIDQYAHHVRFRIVSPRGRPANNPVMELRIAVQFAAAQALERADLELRHLPRSKAAATATLKRLNKLRAALDQFRSPTGFSDAFAAKDSLVSQEPQNEFSLPMMDIWARDVLFSRAGQLQSLIDNFLSAHNLATRKGNNVDPLATIFLRHMIGFWHTLTGSLPATSNKGPFVDLLAAAWADLCFPQPIDREGEFKVLVDYLGERLVKLIPSVRVEIEQLKEIDA